MKKLSEEHYEIVRPYMPVQRGNVRISNLDVINAVLYVAENRCKWCALPKVFGNWHTIYTRLRRWAQRDILDRLFQALQEHQLIRIKIECLGLDSTSVKVMVQELQKKGFAIHWQIPGSLDHQGSSACRE